MGFADASLVHIAERLELTASFSIDYDDFDTYRTGGQRKFRIVPGRRH